MCHCSFLPKHRPCLTNALPNAEVHRVLRNQHSANRMLPYGSDVIGGLWLIFFAKLTQDRVIWEEGRSAEKMPQSDWHVGKPVGHFFDWWLMGGVAHCGWCHTLAGGPGLNKKASWASRGKWASKQHFCVVSASAPSSRFLYEFLPLCHDHCHRKKWTRTDGDDSVLSLPQFTFPCICEELGKKHECHGRGYEVKEKQNSVKRAETVIP